MEIELVTVALVGVDDRSKSAYQIFFKNFKQVNYELIDDCHNAQVCLVDKDAYQIQQQYESLIKSHPDKYILTVSVIDHPDFNNKEFFLKKPIKQDLLQKTLTKIHRLILDENAINVHADQPDQSVMPHGLFPNNKKVTADILNTTTSGSDINSYEKQPKETSTTKVGSLLNIQHKNYYVGQQHEKYYVGQQIDVDINNKEQLITIFYDPNHLLQMIIKQAIIESQKKQKIVQLNVLNYIFYFDNIEQKVYSADRLTVLRPLCVIKNIKQISYKIKADSFRDELYKCFQANNTASSDQLVTQVWSWEYYAWLITLWCSRGRLPKGTNLSQPVYLKRWPNLTRLEQVPHAARIAALIYDKPRTLFNIANQLGIRQRYVFAFFSACNSIGISEVLSKETDRPYESKQPKTNNNKSILSKLLGKLANFSSNAAPNNLTDKNEQHSHLS